MTKKIFLYDRLSVSNQNFTTKHIKTVKNSRFFKVSRYIGNSGDILNIFLFILVVQAQKQNIDFKA